MKKTLLTFSLLLLPLTFTAAHAASGLTGCAAKKQEIETQLSFARQHNNTHQVAGLEKALSEVNQNCTESSLLKQRQEKVAEKKLKASFSSWRASASLSSRFWILLALRPSAFALASSCSRSCTFNFFSATFS